MIRRVFLWPEASYTYVEHVVYNGCLRLCPARWALPRIIAVQIAERRVPRAN